MSSVFHRGRRLASCVAIAVTLASCSDLFTSAPNADDVLNRPLPGLTPEELGTFIRGDAAFEQAFAASQGLGPIFNNVSCASCHSADGRGRPENALMRFGVAPDFSRPIGGPQLNDKAIPGAVAERAPQNVPYSIRLPPPVFGMGLIEAIPDATLLALADANDANGDGISGRPNLVVPADFVPINEPGGGIAPRVGRFSRKAQVSSILEQTVGAYHGDIGITTDFLPSENVNPLASPSTLSADHVADPEVSAATVRAVIEYLRTLAPPAPGEDNPQRARGRDLFQQTGCASCHIPSLTTGPHPIAALANRPAPLYSDLLLHDMGSELADNRPDGDATGSEWRTTPLWGLRVMRQFLNGEAFLLHDGRARTVDAAIRAHGGEALVSRDAFAGLAEADRAALIDFVESR